MHDRTKQPDARGEKTYFAKSNLNGNPKLVKPLGIFSKQFRPAVKNEYWLQATNINIYSQDCAKKFFIDRHETVTHQLFHGRSSRLSLGLVVSMEKGIFLSINKC